MHNANNGRFRTINYLIVTIIIILHFDSDVVWTSLDRTSSVCAPLLSSRHQIECLYS